MHRPVDLGRQSDTCEARYHGTYSAYRVGCRCPHARDAHRLYQKRHREGRLAQAWVDPTGTRRRMEALAAIGWPLYRQMELMGRSRKSGVPSWQGVRVHRATADRVRALYEQLSMTRGPSREAEERARRRGWSPPLAWDDIDDPRARPRGAGKGPAGADEATVLRLMRGEKVKSRPADRREAIRRLAAERMRHEDIAARLHVKAKTVTTSLRRQRRRGVAA